MCIGPDLPVSPPLKIYTLAVDVQRLGTSLLYPLVPYSCISTGQDCSAIPNVQSVSCAAAQCIGELDYLPLGAVLMYQYTLVRLAIPLLPTTPVSQPSPSYPNPVVLDATLFLVILVSPSYVDARTLSMDTTCADASSLSYIHLYMHKSIDQTPLHGNPIRMIGPSSFRI